MPTEPPRAQSKRIVMTKYAKVSARTRAQAIYLLDIASSNDMSITAEQATDEFDCTREAHTLALFATWEVLKVYWFIDLVCITKDDAAVRRAEAAGLLRDGWSPGELARSSRRTRTSS